MCGSWGYVASCSAAPQEKGEGVKCCLQHPPHSPCAPSLQESRAVMGCVLQDSHGPS